MPLVPLDPAQHTLSVSPALLELINLFYEQSLRSEAVVVSPLTYVEKSSSTPPR